MFEAESSETASRSFHYLPMGEALNILVLHVSLIAASEIKSLVLNGKRLCSGICIVGVSPTGSFKRSSVGFFFNTLDYSPHRGYQP